MAHTPNQEPLPVAAVAWCTVIVRAWRDGDGLKVRLLKIGSSGDEAAVETSVVAASRRLATWLSVVEQDPPTSSSDARPDARPDGTETRP
jgi:hypothetical protein